MEKILVINCGSSSIKYEIFSMPSKESLGKGLVERIGLKDALVKQKSWKGEYHLEQGIANHAEAMDLLLNAVTDKEKGILASVEEVKAVGHRIVHGGEAYSGSVIIDQNVKKAIEDNIVLAPLHNPANLTGISEITRILPNVPQVAVFDTAFHQTLESHAYLYGLPREFYDKHKIRRYGFHGTSHRYVYNQALKLVRRVADNTNAISCHLGNGASITSIYHGRSTDTSMGFTPLEGLVMGTRCGDLDPYIVLHLMKLGYSVDEVNTLLNKKSGMLGLSGVSSDMRDIEKASFDGNRNAQEALEVYAYKIRKYIGSYSANLVKVDVLIFTGGIGENQISMRELVCSKLENLGMVIDSEKNKQNGNKLGIISKEYSPTSIVVVPTNEELQIAMDTYDIAF